MTIRGFNWLWLNEAGRHRNVRRFCGLGESCAWWFFCVVASACACHGGSIDVGDEPSGPFTASDFSGTTYFVDADRGNDAYSGRLAQPDPSHSDGPFRTAQAGYDRLRRGDRLYIREGVYRETVTLHKRATASSPITIQAFPGEEGRAVIGAADEVLGWQRCTSQAQCAGNPNWQHIFYVDVDFEVRQLFQGGSRLRLSRYPSQGWLYPTSISWKHPNTMFFDSSLRKAEGYFTGSVCHVKTAMWHVDHIDVSAYSADDGRITLASPTRYAISPEFGYYFTNVVRAIDAPGEWAYDYVQQRVYLWPEGESLDGIEASVREFGIDTYEGCSYHVIEGLAIKYAAEDGIRLYRTDHMTVRNNTIDYSYAAGLREYEGTYACLIGNTVSFSNVRGITDRALSSFHLVQGNTVYATGAQNFGDDAAGGEGHGIFIGGSHADVIQNRVDRSSYSGIYIDGQTSGREIAYNYITDACLSLSDGGGIYTEGRSSSGEPDRYHHNIIANVWGHLGGWAGCRELYSMAPELCRGGAYGIYLDEESNSRICEDNAALHCGAAGIYLHWTKDNRLLRNTAYGNSECQILFAGKDEPRFVLQGNDMEGNLLIATQPVQVTFQLNVDYREVAFGRSDGNYFHHPTSSRHIGINRDIDRMGYIVCSLGEWQRLSGGDFHSRDLSPSVNADAPVGEAVVFINPSMATAAIDLGVQEYRDVDGMPVTGTVSVGPFECLVLFREPALAESGR
jgi:parallel beta-helix repeat protein